jgi:uncharacterized protein YecT (DUF1311 family)
MRFVLIAAFSAVLVPAAVAPGTAAGESRPSLAACDTAKLGGGDLAQCLRAAADKADRDLQGAVEQAIRSIDARQGLLSSQKARWRRSLSESQAQWLSWRDAECQDVAPFEAGMMAKGADPRLACIIDNDEARIMSIKARYP